MIGPERTVGLEGVVNYNYYIFNETVETSRQQVQGLILKIHFSSKSQLRSFINGIKLCFDFVWFLMFFC